MTKATQRIGGIKAALGTPTWLRRGMNVWPPYLFAGVRIEDIAADYFGFQVSNFQFDELVRDAAALPIPDAMVVVSPVPRDRAHPLRARLASRE